ncbi:MAG: hypothetical protein V1767_09185 [Chloroflexota bacterium]
MSPVNWCNYTIEYEEAVNLLLDNMIKTGRQNLVFPTIFLYRQYIELMLKEIILNNWAFLEISKPFPKGHDIYKLWEICRKAMQETNKLVDPQFAESQDYVKEIIQAYNALETDLKKFAEIDPDSQCFRYPIDAQGNPIVVDQKLLTKLLRKLPYLVKRISFNLNGISSGIYTILQDKYEGLAQQRNL